MCYRSVSTLFFAICLSSIRTSSSSLASISAFSLRASSFAPFTSLSVLADCFCPSSIKSDACYFIYILINYVLLLMLISQSVVIKGFIEVLSSPKSFRLSAALISAEPPPPPPKNYAGLTCSMGGSVNGSSSCLTSSPSAAFLFRFFSNPPPFTLIGGPLINNI